MTQPSEPVRHRVLIAFDGSDHAETAVEQVQAFAWPASTQARVVGVVTQGAYRRGWFADIPTPDVEHLAARRHGRALRAVSAVATELQDRGLNANAATRSGKPAKQLLEEAASYQPTLIAAGSRGLGVITSALLGSVSRRLVEEATCPVLVSRKPSLQRVVLATDGTDLSLAAEALLASLPLPTSTEVRVVSIADASTSWERNVAPGADREYLESELRDPARRRDVHEGIARAAAGRLSGRLAGVDHRAWVGPAGDELVMEVETWPADLIVLGSRRLQGMKRVMLGSVSSKVLVRATCSVLVA